MQDELQPRPRGNLLLHPHLNQQDRQNGQRDEDHGDAEDPLQTLTQTLIHSAPSQTRQPDAPTHVIIPRTQPQRWAQADDQSPVALAPERTAQDRA